MIDPVISPAGEHQFQVLQHVTLKRANRLSCHDEILSVIICHAPHCIRQAHADCLSRTDRSDLQLCLLPLALDCSQPPCKDLALLPGKLLKLKYWTSFLHSLRPPLSFRSFSQSSVAELSNASRKPSSSGSSSSRSPSFFCRHF